MDFPTDLKNDPKDIERRGVLRSTTQKKIRSRVGILLSIYFDEGWSRIKRQAILDCLSEYLAIFSNDLTHFQVGDEPKMRSYDSSGVPSPYLSLPDTPESELAYVQMLAVDPKEPDDPSLWRFMALAQAKDNSMRPLSGVKAHFPPSFAFDDPDRFLSLIAGWCGKLAALHGSAGLGALSDPGRETRGDAYFYPWLTQYPALEYDAMAMFFLESKDGGWRSPRSSNWLTMLGKENVEALGGVEAIERKGGGHVSIESFDGGGLVLRAGRLPALGNGPDGVPAAYRTAARIIKPIRFEAYKWGVIKEPFPVDGPSVTLEWIRRFD